jgi:thymidylate kinase
MKDSQDPCAVLVSGIQAAGKSTIGRSLAERFPKGAFLDGDWMRKLIVTGRADMKADPSEEAIRQLHLRYRNGTQLIDNLVASGFTAIHGETVLEDGLSSYPGWVKSRPLRIVLLTPDPKTVMEREIARGSRAYEKWMIDGRSFEDAVRQFHEWVQRTPKIGLRVDSTDQTPDETVENILARWDEAVV